MSVPIALAEANGKCTTGQKALLADVLNKGIKCPSAIDMQAACLMIDGRASVAGKQSKLGQIPLRTFNSKCTSIESRSCCGRIFRWGRSAIVKPIG